ncbi:hypothetical protein BJ878DRAFT_539990 [Calycina marina]|uniref:Uncharacterized protein n=1 Tax=Calycina marina TaxID=1763456 RepID=A0A9P8CHB6_9HELO|nr:hypothetical protein BJ878DRAFT_539990 [Calycina marina]
MAGTSFFLLILLVLAINVMPPAPQLDYAGWKYDSCLSSQPAPERLLANFALASNSTAPHAIDGYPDPCLVNLDYAALVDGECYCAVNTSALTSYKTELDAVFNCPCDNWPRLSCGGTIDPATNGPKAISLYSRTAPALPQSQLQVLSNETTTAVKEDIDLASATSQAPISTGLFLVQKQGIGEIRLLFNDAILWKEPARTIVGMVVGLMAVMLAFLIVS